MVIWLKENQSKKTAKKIFSDIEIWISRAMREDYAEIQNSMTLKIFLPSFLELFPFNIPPPIFNLRGLCIPPMYIKNHKKSRF